MILFINACVRENSRTALLAGRFLAGENDEIREVCLEKVSFPRTDEKFLNWRDSCIDAGDFSDPLFRYALDFAVADEIVIAAPFWDMSFPASLKQYFEHINVQQITFRYTDEGIPEGLCKARKLTYITTAGGPVDSWDYGFGYVKALCNGFYGIDNVELISAEGLDIVGADVEKILKEAGEKIK